MTASPGADIATNRNSGAPDSSCSEWHCPRTENSTSPARRATQTSSLLLKPRPPMGPVQVRAPKTSPLAESPDTPSSSSRGLPAASCPRSLVVQSPITIELPATEQCTTRTVHDMPSPRVSMQAHDANVRSESGQTIIARRPRRTAFVGTQALNPSPHSTCSTPVISFSTRSGVFFWTSAAAQACATPLVSTGTAICLLATQSDMTTAPLVARSGAHSGPPSPVSCSPIPARSPSALTAPHTAGKISSTASTANGATTLASRAAQATSAIAPSR